jgi:hypothetical protein
MTAAALLFPAPPDGKQAERLRDGAVGSGRKPT